MRLSSYVLRAAIVSLGLIQSAGAAEPKQVLVFTSAADGSMKAAGKAPPPPTAAQPAYYVIMPGGLVKKGSIPKGDDIEKVTAEVVWPALQQTLAARHYLPAQNGAEPSLLLVFHWGVMNLGQEGEEDHDLVFDTEHDRKLAMNLVGGSRAQIESTEMNDAMNNAGKARYLVVVSAFDYASLKKKQKKLYWRARMSTETGGTSLAESIVPLLRSGAAFFGRDSGQGQEIVWDRTTVTIGETTVDNSPAPRSANPSPTKSK